MPERAHGVSSDQPGPSPRARQRRVAFVAITSLALVAVIAPMAVGRDRPFGTADVFLMKWGSAPEEFEKIVRGEVAKWARLVKDAGIQEQ